MPLEVVYTSKTQVLMFGKRSSKYGESCSSKKHAYLLVSIGQNKWWKVEFRLDPNSLTY